MRKTAAFVLLIVFAMLSGCTSTKVKQTPIEPPKELAKMWMSEGPFPASGDYEVLGVVKKQNISYWGADDIEPDLAREAAELGADAVIEVERGRRVAAFGLASPYGRGKAIRILNKSMDMSRFKEVYFETSESKK